MKNLLFALSLLWSVAVVAQWKTSTPFGAEFKDIAFVDDFTGYAVAQSGGLGGCSINFSLCKTIDGGKNWIRIGIGTTSQPRALHFVNPMIGWIACSSSEVLKTTDGGQTWNQVTYGVGSGYNDIWFINETIGFVIGNNGLLRKSTNGGASWQTIASGTTDALRKMHFASDNLGYIMAGNTTLRTTDGGNSWDEVAVPDGFINDMSFVDENTGFAVGGNSDGNQSCFKTTNGGASWTHVELPAGSGTRVFFPSAAVGFVTSVNSEVMKTEDGGQTWNLSTTMNGNGDSWRTLYFINENEGYIAGYLGRINKTTDGGQTWVNQHSGFQSQGNSVAIVHKDTAYFGQQNGMLFKTYNAGRNTQQVLPVQDDGVVKIETPEPAKVVAAFFHSIRKSVDSGNTWELKFQNPEIFITDLHFPTALTGYASTLDSLFIKTVDGGDTWEILETGFDDYFRTVFFTSALDGYMVSDDTVYKTTDGGLTWSDYSLNQFPLSIIGSTRDIVFGSPEVGFIINSQKVFWTRNAGETWEERRLTNGNTYNELWMANDSLGYFTRNSSQGMTVDSCANLSSISTACLANNWSMHGIDMIDGGDFGYSVGGLSGLLHQKEIKEIAQPFLSANTYCQGSNMFVGFISRGLNFGESIYEIELSDAQGSFDAPMVIGTSDMSDFLAYQSNIATCTLPSGLPPGSGYRIRVVNTSFDTVSPDNGYDIQIDNSFTPTVSIALVPQTSNCVGADAVVSATFSNAGLNPDFNWNINGSLIENSGSNLYLELTAGEIIVQCEMTSSLSCAPGSPVSEITLNFSDGLEINLPQTVDICAGATVELSGNPDYDYSWFPAEGLDNSTVANPTVSVTEPTTYFATATDANGCSKTDSVAVLILPNPEILTSDMQVCSGSNIQLQATPNGTYSWTPNEQLSATDIAFPVATVTTSTNFFVEITSAAGCLNTDSVFISVEENINILTQDISVCTSDTLQLEAQDAYEYIWSPAENLDQSDIQNPIVSVFENTVVFLEATSALGCISVDSIVVSVFPMTMVNFEVVPTLCAGECLELAPEFSAPISTIVWSPALSLNDSTIANPTACPLDTTEFVLEFVDENNCSGESNFTLNILPLPNVPVISFEGSVLTSSEAENYQWFLNEEAIDGAIAQAYTPSENGGYTLETTNTEGCSVLSETYQVTTIGIEDLSIFNGTAVFPNPFLDKLEVIWDENLQPSEIIIVGLLGQIIYADTINNPAINSHQIQIENLAGGVYYLLLVDEGRILETICAVKK